MDRFFLLTLLILLSAALQILARGHFELRLAEDSRPEPLNETLTACLKQFQTVVRVDGLCGIGSAAISLQNKSSLQIPFDFEWKEHYTLIVHFSRENTVVDQLAKSDRLRPGSAWTRASTENGILYFDYRIQCESGFYGADCMRQCRPAKNRICSLDGIPQCAPGWRGVLCREPVCESGCEHGKCIEPGKCICSSGFEGERCDQCISMKGCVHGSCSTPFGCDCEPGWGGTNCNTSTSICTRTRPCHNGGICRPIGDLSFSCQCPAGFTGPTCSTALSACSGPEDPCSNGAECVPVGTFEFFCRCAQGWSGKLCDRPSPRECRNGGFYIEGFGCRCPVGFSGEHCETGLGGRKICFESPRGRLCRCAKGFEGENCDQEKLVNPCGAENLCKNSGWCESNLDSFKCHCPQCFTGADCSQRDPACDESQQLRLITIILGITVLLVIVMLLLIVFIVRKRLGNENRRDSHTIKTKESKIYSLPSEYASRYAADPCERRIGTTNSRLREAAEKALREESFYAEIDALSSV